VLLVKLASVSYLGTLVMFVVLVYDMAEKFFFLSTSVGFHYEFGALPYS